MITVNGTQMVDPFGRWWPSDKTGETGAAPLDLAVITRVAGLGEQYAPSPGHGPIVWPLVMRIAGADYDETRRNKDDLDALLLSRHIEAEIVMETASRLRMAHGIVAAGTEVERISYGQRIDVAYPVRISKGRWFDTYDQSVTLGAGNRISGTQADGTYRLSQLVGGSRDMDPIVSIVGNGATTDVRVTDVDSGQWVRIAGNITAGAAVTIDPLALTATPGYSGLLDFSAREFHLAPSARIRVQQNGPQAVTITARRAYA